MTATCRQGLQHAPEQTEKEKKEKKNNKKARRFFRKACPKPDVILVLGSSFEKVGLNRLPFPVVLTF